jgi:hypothetical protein
MILHRQLRDFHKLSDAATELNSKALAPQLERRMTMTKTAQSKAEWQYSNKAPSQ